MMWLRYDLDAAPVHPDLYASLGGTAAMLLHGRAAADVFFVHTPPGLRLRCLAVQPNTVDVAWRAALAEAVDGGLVAGWRPAPFVPEPLGLGGPDAMAAAHRVFTADSQAWLEFHARAPRPVPTVSRWAMSLLMVRALADALGLTHREADDLWDRVSRSTRRLEAFDPAEPAVRKLAGALRGGWDHPDSLRERLSPHQHDLLATYEAAIAPAADGWRAAAGPSLRHGAALAVIFHWNRSAMPVSQQRLLATALTRLVPRPTPVAA
jgi:thiopeptide-type bacteriocin biosynthesis protein